MGSLRITLDYLCSLVLDGQVPAAILGVHPAVRDPRHWIVLAEKQLTGLVRQGDAGTCKQDFDLGSKFLFKMSVCTRNS